MNRLLAGLASLALCFVVACAEKAPPPEKFVEGRRLMDAGDYAAAQTYFEGEIAANPGDPEPVFLAGQAAAIGARYAEAEAHFNKALELKPETAAYYSWLGRLYGAQARNADLMAQVKLAPKVRDNFEKAVELGDPDPETRYFLALFYSVAPPGMGGDPAKAEAFATEMKAEHPLLAHRIQAVVHTARKQPDLAETELQAASTLAPEDPQSFSDLGSHYLSQQKLDLARENFQKSLALDPDFPSGLLGLGQVAAFSPDDTDAGIASLVRLLDLPPSILSPNLGMSANILGALYERKGQGPEALAAYEKAAGLGFGPAKKKVAELKAPAPEAPATTGTLESAVPAEAAAAPDQSAVAPADPAAEAPQEGDVSADAPPAETTL